MSGTINLLNSPYNISHLVADFFHIAITAKEGKNIYYMVLYCRREPEIFSSTMYNISQFGGGHRSGTIDPDLK